MSKSGSRRLLAAGSIAAAVVGGVVGCTPPGSGSSAPEDESAEGCGFYEGATLEFVVGRTPGGGFDFYTRAIAEELKDVLGANVVVLNEPGAGGLIATNSTWAAKPDGLRIEFVSAAGIISADMAESEGVQYTASEFTWLARVTAEPAAVSVATDGRFGSFEEMLAAPADDPVVFVSAGNGGSDFVHPSVMEYAFGMEVENVAGFGGADDAWLAVLRGDADAHARSVSGTLVHINSGDASAVAVIGSERDPLVPDVPTVFELIGDDVDDEKLAVLESHVAMVETSRAIIAPPGLPDNLRQCLGDALETVMTDPDWVAEMAAQDRPVGYLGGEELDALLATVSDAPPAYVDIVKRAFEGGADS